MSFLDRFRNHQNEENIQNQGEEIKNNESQSLEAQAREFRESLRVDNINTQTSEESEDESSGGFPQPFERGDEYDAPPHNDNEESIGNGVEEGMEADMEEEM